MQRVLLLFLAALAVVAFLPGEAAAQSWPAGGKEFVHGPGFYFAIWKLLLMIPLVLLWARSTSWLAEDIEEYGTAIKQKPEVWNAVAVFTFFVGFVIVGLSIPIFFAGWFVMLLCWAGPICTYLLLRDGKVPEDRRVFTPAGMLRTITSLFTGKKARKHSVMREPWEMGPQVDMTAVSPLQGQNQSAMIEARQNPAYISVKALISDALNARADKIRLDYTADAVAVRYMIDGMWHAANPKVHEKEPFNRPLGDAMLFVFKRISHLNPQDRRTTQKGKFQIGYQGAKYDTQVMSQGTQTGEAVMITMTPIRKVQRTLEELGMREKMREQLKELLLRKQGLFVLCSMPGDGLTATWLATLKSSDRLLRDFVSVESPTTMEPHEVENIEHNTFDPAKGETAVKVQYKLKLRQPDVYVIPSIEGGDVLGTLLDQIEDESKAGIVSVRAREAVEALVRLLSMKPDEPEKFITHVSGVLNQRLVRKLCEQCREAVPLTPELAQRLRIPAGRVQFLYREKQPLPPGQDPPKGVPLICPNCRGLGYKGRIAIYELLVITDQLREVLRKKPQVEVLRQYAAKGGHPSLQEEGILLAAAGVTSLPELQRVLKPT